MNPHSKADLAQVLADLNASAQAQGRPANWRPRTLSEAVQAATPDPEPAPPVDPARPRPRTP